MTDKKFTDEEIIKALECHVEAEDCESCEMFGNCEEIVLTERVLDLINRQKAEIEKLRRVFKTAVCERDMVQAQKDFERRKSTCEMLGFAKDAENMSALEILNYYRNLYHADPSNTERGIVANAINDALTLINRQATEIEKVKSNCHKLCEYAEKKERELVKINADISWFREAKVSRLAPAIKEIEAEAIKEFAKRLKEKRWDAECRVGYVQVVDVGDIDDVLKEMVGEDE